MGTSGWDEESWDRGRSPREGRGGRPDNRAYDRSSRGGPPPPRTADRPERSMRGRPNPEDDAERPRGSRRDDEWRTPPGGRSSSRRSPDGPPGDWDSGRRGSVNGRGRPPADDWDRGGERGRPPRDDRRDPYDDRGGRDGRGMERAGDRSMRGPRPSSRDDEWDGSPRGRGGAPAAAGARTRAPGRGGLWDDEPMRRRADGSDPRGRAMGSRVDPRDPRSLRRGLIDTSAAPAVGEKKGGITFGKAILLILLMFVVGAGAAFGYWKVSTPPLPSDTTTAPSSATPATSGTPANGKGTPGVTPSATQHAFTSPNGHVAIVAASRV